MVALITRRVPAANMLGRIPQYVWVSLTVSDFAGFVEAYHLWTHYVQIQELGIARKDLNHAQILQNRVIQFVWDQKT